MSRSRYGGLGDDPYAMPQRDEDDYDPYGTTYVDRYGTPPLQGRPSPAPGFRSGGSRAPPRMIQESNAEKQIGVVLEHIRSEWPAMCRSECVPVQLALQLLDTSSVGRAHEFEQFERSHQYLQDSLKAIVHEHHQGFNSSIGTFHKIQTSIHTSQKKVRSLKESLKQSQGSLVTTDPELRKLGAASQTYDDLIHTLSEIEELRLVPDLLEARISEKRFLTAVDILQGALRRIRAPELDGIGALGDLKTYLSNQEAALTDILVEELHAHLYLKSPYCQERWHLLAQEQGASEQVEKAAAIRPFFEILDEVDFITPPTEDPFKNPEGDTFVYIDLLVEALNKLGRLESAVNTIKQRLPVELFGIVNETNNEVDQKHPSSLRGSATGSHSQATGSRENKIRADVIYDLLRSLYAKFEAIAEGHRVFNDAVKATLRREGSKDAPALLGSFRELWNLYQNEIKSLLHNYVTTDADVYQFNSTRPGANKQESKNEVLFQFSGADSKSIEMTTEYHDLEGIITAAVPGLVSSSRKNIDGKKQALKSENSTDASRRANNSSNYDSKANGITTHRSLVEPSVFNMSLLLPPTLSFLQRLKSIVPPGSDLVTSTLTSFLDNFLVNVFLPQLDETLMKLSESVFDEADAFQQHPQWAQLSRRPIFRGAVAFFDLITAFCKMLDTIPHDQALSQLIITQMMRYYDRCFEWFKSLVSSSRDTDTSMLKLSPRLATEPGKVLDIIKSVWSAEKQDKELLDKEMDLLISQTNKKPMLPDDVIQDRETIASLCLLYTSMKWLALKVEKLRHITKSDSELTQSNTHRPGHRRWTLLNDPIKLQDLDGSVYLPMTQETVVAFDSIVSSYQELAATTLFTIHIEARCQIISSLSTSLTPTTASYLLEEPVNDPGPHILRLNGDLAAYDSTSVQYLRDPEIAFIRIGLGSLINKFLVTNAGMVQTMNSHGCGRMQLNILVLQQNLKNIEKDANLERAAKYYDLFNAGPEAIIQHAKDSKDTDDEPFTYDELKTLIELSHSEQLNNPERGISTTAKRAMGEHLLHLSEYLWQS